MATEIVIVGMSMVTALGLDAVQTAANVRAGMSGFRELAWLDKAFQPFVGAFLPDDVLDPLSEKIASAHALTYREDRILRLAGLPLKEVIASIKGRIGPLPLVVGMPEIDQTSRWTDKEVLAYLADQSGVPIDAPRSSVFFKGRAAGLLAVHTACENLRSGKMETVVAGGADTFKDLYTLGTLDMESRVSSTQNRDGLIPSEGACFLLLTTRRNAQAKGWPVRAAIMASATGFEKGHLGSKEPYQGDGLFATFSALFAAAGAAKPVQTVYASFNGENHWAKEWGVTAIRHKSHLTDDFQIEHPADCIGDTGAACGPLMAGMATIGIEQGYRREPVAAYASSDHGDRAAVLIGGSSQRG
jgi:3-oxoacyl-[acyl-carrier-protein] synthase-1